jgi:hypothetical protein
MRCHAGGIYYHRPSDPACFRLSPAASLRESYGAESGCQCPTRESTRASAAGDSARFEVVGCESAGLPGRAVTVIRPESQTGVKRPRGRPAPGSRADNQYRRDNGTVILAWHPTVGPSLSDNSVSECDSDA